MQKLILAAASLAFLVGSNCVSQCRAEERISLSIYFAHQDDLCPGGYAQSEKCALFTGSKFDTLPRRRLRLAATFPNIPIHRLPDGKFEGGVGLGELLSFVRKCLEIEDTPPDCQSPILIVAEWLPPADGEITTASIHPKKKQNRRAFGHARLRNLNPEEDYPWLFFQGRLRISFE
jgi:hypothetical protein